MLLPLRIVYLLLLAWLPTRLAAQPDEVPPRLDSIRLPPGPRPPLWGISANLWHPTIKQHLALVYNLRGERLIGARTALLLDVAFGRRRFSDPAGLRAPNSPAA